MTITSLVFLWGNSSRLIGFVSATALEAVPYKVAIRLCEHRLSPCRNLRFRHPPSDAASPCMYNFRLPNQRFGASGMSEGVARRKARREGSLCPQQGVPSPPYKVAIRLCEIRLSLRLSASPKSTSLIRGRQGACRRIFVRKLPPSFKRNGTQAVPYGVVSSER